MVYQFDPELNPNGLNFIKEWGCYFCALLKIAEETRGRKFSAQEAYSVYLAAQYTGIVQKEEFNDDGTIKDGCTVYDPDALLHLAGGQGSVRKVSGASYRCAPNERQILRFYNPSTGYRHFVVGDGKGGVDWDPLEKSKTAREGYIEEQRIITL